MVKKKTKRLKRKIKKTIRIRLKNRMKGGIKTRMEKKRKVSTSHLKKSRFKASSEKEESIETPIHKIKIKIVGVGGGGVKIVSELSQRVKRVSFLVADTDVKSLRRVSKKVITFQFGENLANGLGTGMDWQLGESAAETAKEEIKKLLKGQDLIIFVVSLGGGVGSGAIPLFAKISKNLRNLNFAIFTLPFKFEGEKKMRVALESLEKVKPYLNAFTIIPNEKIFQIIEKNTPLPVALSAMNGILADSLEGLIETVYEAGLINIDFADLKTILKGFGKLSILYSTQVQKKEDSLNELIKGVTTPPLYTYDIRGARGILLNIAGEKSLTLEEISQISGTIAGMVSREAKFIFGISQKNKYRGLIKTTILATGCGAKVKKAEQSVTKMDKGKKPEITGKKVIPIGKSEEKIRKNAIQVKEEMKKMEKEILEKEKSWEIPTFLRKKRTIQ